MQSGIQHAFFQQKGLQTPWTTFHCMQWARQFHGLKGRAATACPGQNLVELALTIGITMIFLFVSVELARAWHAYHTARHAAMDGAVVAAQTQSVDLGEQRVAERLAAANLPIKAVAITAREGGRSFEVTVSVSFEPLFGGLSLPTPAGALNVVPGAFDITYTGTEVTATF